MPNPGSDEALDMGCTCAVLDNGHGKGYFGEPGVFVMSEDCPLHGSESNKTMTELTSAKKAEMILSKLNSLGNQQDAIFRALAEMEKGRNKAVAELKKSHQRCALWIKAFTILSVLTLGITGTTVYLFLEYIKYH